jgi:hypothetical protein
MVPFVISSLIHGLFSGLLNLGNYQNPPWGIVKHSSYLQLRHKACLEYKGWAGRRYLKVESMKIHNILFFKNVIIR